MMFFVLNTFCYTNLKKYSDNKTIHRIISGIYGT